MGKLVTFSKSAVLTFALGALSVTVSAYEIKHGYPAENGMTYYGVCNNGKDLVVLETEDGQFVYEGPASKGILATDGSLDKAARKACGE